MIKQALYGILIFSFLSLFTIATAVETEPDYLSYTKSLTYNELLLDFYSDTGDDGSDASGWITTFSSLFIGDMDRAFSSMEEMGIIRPEDFAYFESLHEDTREGDYSRVYELLGMDENNQARLAEIKEDIDSGNTKEAYELLQLDPDEITRLEEMVSEINDGNYDRTKELLPMLGDIISAIFVSGKNDSGIISEKTDVMPVGDWADLRDLLYSIPVESDSIGLHPDGGEGYVFDAIHSSYDIISSGTYHLVQNQSVTDAPYAIRISADDVHLNGNLFGLAGNNHGTGIEILGDRVSLENFNAITNFHTGISSKKNGGLEISRCFIGENVNGIQISDADSVQIATNAFYRNSGETIEMADVGEAIVVENLISDNAGQITLFGGKDAFVQANILSDNSGGITVSDYTFMNVTTNLLSSNSGGIFLSRSGTAEVTNNVLSSNTGGVTITDVDSARVRGNLLDDNENGGISVSGGEFIMIMLNMVSNEECGIRVSGAERAGMFLNLLIADGKEGIEVTDVTDVAVHYNTLGFTNGRAISVSSAKKALLICNTLAYNKGAVFISDIDELFFGSNTLSYNLGSAVFASRITNASILTNTIAYHEKNGIILREADASELQRNVISYHGNDGLSLEDCNMTRIIENVLSYCNDNAISLSECSGVVLSDNVLYGNGNQVGVLGSNGTVMIRENTENALNTNPSVAFFITEGSLQINPGEMLSGSANP